MESLAIRVAGAAHRAACTGPWQGYNREPCKQGGTGWLGAGGRAFFFLSCYRGYPVPNKQTIFKKLNILNSLRLPIPHMSGWLYKSILKPIRLFHCINLVHQVRFNSQSISISTFISNCQLLFFKVSVLLTGKVREVFVSQESLTCTYKKTPGNSKQSHWLCHSPRLCAVRRSTHAHAKLGWAWVIWYHESWPRVNTRLANSHNCE